MFVWANYFVIIFRLFNDALRRHGEKDNKVGAVAWTEMPHQYLLRGTEESHEEPQLIQPTSTPHGC
jgi:hypothetical protein